MAPRIKYEYIFTATREGKTVVDRVKSLREAKWLLVNHLNHDREVTVERIEL